jgi:hypothetical protein
LIITSISAARRLAERDLQASGVKIDFVVGVADTSSANKASSALAALSSGQSVLVQAFVATLNQNLSTRGKATVQVAPSQIKFARAEVTTASSSMTSPNVVLTTGQYFGGESATGNSSDSPKTQDDSGSSSNLVLILLLVVVAAGALYVLIGRKKAHVAKDESAGFDSYVSKVGDVLN